MKRGFYNWTQKHNSEMLLYLYKKKQLSEQFLKVKDLFRNRLVRTKVSESHTDLQRGCTILLFLSSHLWLIRSPATIFENKSRFWSLQGKQNAPYLQKVAEQKKVSVCQIIYFYLPLLNDWQPWAIKLSNISIPQKWNLKFYQMCFSCDFFHFLLQNILIRAINALCVNNSLIIQEKKHGKRCGN